MSTDKRINSTALTAAVLAALSIIFLPLGWLLGTAAVLTARRARREIAQSGEGGDAVASLSLAAGWASVGIVTIIIGAFFLSTVVSNLTG